MKKIYAILFSILIFGCTDLEIKPVDASTEFEIFKDQGAYQSYLAKLYAAYSQTGQDGPAGNADISIVNDEGFTSYIRAYWKAQELTTDEAVISWADAGIRDLHEQSWTSENQFVRVLYYRISLIITIANDFLKQSTDEKLGANGIDAASKVVIQQYRTEARFLRALAYWHALDLFRNVVLLTDITAGFPLQSSPAETFAFIESELADIESVIADPKTNEYGRADKAAVWMLQAKLYLNAEVYINTPKYTEVLAACNKVIGAGYSLSTNYQNLFLADNHTSNEIIFALNSDGKNTQNWGNTTFLIHGAMGGFMVDNLQDGTESNATPTPQPTEELDVYGVTGGWAGLRTTRSMVEKFYNNPAAIDVNNPNDPRAIFYTNGQSLDITDIAEFTDGLAVPKYKNLTSDGTPGSDLTHADTDYPMFRLADAYLMYVEAVLRGGTGGDMATAIGYINDLRTRAYGNSTGNIVAADVTLDFVLDERVRELYWEGTRRVDLIRYGRYTDAGVWPWKGNVEAGKTTEAFRNVFPIPASDLIANPNLVQNNGY